MKTKHTPGPWDVEIRDDDAVVLVGGTRAIIASVPPNYVTEREEEVLTPEGAANARLIAAAPALLAFAESVAEYQEYRDDDEDPSKILGRIEAAARAAIAAATGDES